ncbi:MAG: glycoside hydrolase family 15 protein [Nanoarchaeota archaeon]|nr:glycoside hydrolase family 15 protein [Nanoarchaeota archaeon]MBU1269526.1 glycoside hydrolase family 15 protein [Nanoarchaeota archaeon]MBU1604767.1 glycoside hydrolase family 15 protein [Nanoarchaeota archaeon]MBU2442911.1 glycoside hydrolase family 15 protein [Nanoarchaeota archaeon]
MLDYGIIGNCITCALVKKDTSIDWFCFPKFNSSSAFAKILDKDIGGHFKISPVGKYQISQSYVKNTNILETVFYNDNEEFVVYDFFPRYRKILSGKKRKLYSQNRIIRIVKPLKGRPKIIINYDPRLNYAIGDNVHEKVEGNLITKNKNIYLSLISNVSFDSILKNDVVELDYTKYFVIGVPDEAKDFDVKKCLRLMNDTKKYWQMWVSTLTLPEKNRDGIIRSALTLKLLTYSETGAIIAAPTTSIPEEVGSDRTFDYRFCWVRDASFTVDALKKIGRDYEAKRLMEFIIDSTSKSEMKMQIMYGIEGESKLTEKELRHLKGYKDSRPVRIGNAAYNQKQNDIYGSIIDIIYLYFVYYQYESKIPLKYWQFVKYLVHEIELNWNKEDHGIWEFRGEKKHFLYSKLLCYVGMSRAKLIADKLNKKKHYVKWDALKEKIHADIMEKGWNEEKQAFTMFHDSKDLDAAILMMSYHEFLDFKDEKLNKTILKIKEELAEGFKVKRYRLKDDFGESKSYFTICSFWLVDALYSTGREEEAEKMYDELVKYSNHLGLYSEDLTKDNLLIGNFPQAYTHIAMINSSILLSEWSQKRIKLQMKGKRRRVK